MDGFRAESLCARSNRAMMLSTYFRGEAGAARAGAGRGWGGGRRPPGEPRGPCSLGLWPRPPPFPKSLYTCSQPRRNTALGNHRTLSPWGPQRPGPHQGTGRGGEGRAGNLRHPGRRGLAAAPRGTGGASGGQRRAWRARAEGSAARDGTRVNAQHPPECGGAADTSAGTGAKRGRVAD